jgi:hypothetical protein
MRRSFLAVAVASSALAASAVPALADGGSSSSHGGGPSQSFIPSAVEHADGTVTLPLHRGTSRGRTVYYILLASSDGNQAAALGINHAQKLANAANTGAVEHVTMNHGTVEDAPQIARDQNGDGRIQLGSEAADKVVSIDTSQLTVTYRETNGFQGGKPVRYISTDATDPLAATLEDATLAPDLNAAPSPGDDSGKSARATLVAFVNGQTGANNPQRQGLNSAVAGDGDPLNVLKWNPSQGNYSPLWDVNLAQWSAADVNAGRNVRQTDVGTIQNLADHGEITAPGGGTFGASGFIVNCPIVAFG